MIDVMEPAALITAVMDEETSILELAVRGPWDHRLLLIAHRRLRKCLAEHPAGLLLDVRDVDDPQGRSALFWLTAHAQGRKARPPVPVAACRLPGTPLAEALDRLGARRHFFVFDTMEQARDALAGRRPWTGEVRLRLPPELGAATIARHTVTEACVNWGMPGLLDRARLIVSELVVNAAEHAGTPISVVISHVDSGLHLAVHDGSPDLPQMRRTEILERGQGLMLVDTAADAWGVLPARTGKMVWVLLRHLSSGRAVP